MGTKIFQPLTATTICFIIFIEKKIKCCYFTTLNGVMWRFICCWEVVFEKKVLSVTFLLSHLVIQNIIICLSRASCESRLIVLLFGMFCRNLMAKQDMTELGFRTDDGSEETKMKIQNEMEGWICRYNIFVKHFFVWIIYMWKLSN